VPVVAAEAPGKTVFKFASGTLASLGDAGSVSFLHPIECVMLTVLDLDQVL
jgi:hypothetical protein